LAEKLGLAATSVQPVFYSPASSLKELEIYALSGARAGDGDRLEAKLVTPPKSKSPEYRHVSRR
jgi:hypothetical protein